MADRLPCLVGLVVLLVARPCVAWESWGGDPAGSRFSPLREITSDNVGKLIRVRLIALDAKTGLPCADFGKGGEIKFDIGMPLEWPGEFQITSPPAVGRGVVVVGFSIGDNCRVDAPSGVVRAFDARSGDLRWTFEPLKRDGIEAGHANVGDRARDCRADDRYAALASSTSSYQLDMMLACMRCEQSFTS
ncbi:hypothetical protein QWJ07_10765 [Frankia sp. RB7]|nr:hypothetical protein [Frankia sp. RB7]